MKHTTLYRLTAALLVCSCAIAPAWAGVTVSLDRTQVAVGERVRLLIQNDSNQGDQPNLTPLRQDFNIVGSSQGSSTQIVNGRFSSQRQFTVFLEPTHEGSIKIGPIQWGAEQSPALVLSVGSSAVTGKPGANASVNAAPVAISATLDNKQPYVQAAVVMTLKVYVGVPMLQASLDWPSSSDVLAKQVGEDKQSTEVRNGRNYQVIERKYVLIPQRSGKISLKGPVFEGQVQDVGSIDGSDIDAFFGNVFGHSPLSRMMGGTRPVKLAASPIEINVLPRPDSNSASNWLPARKVTLQETWRPDGETIRVGEPLTRHLHLSALGLTGAQLPDLSALMPVPDGLKAYPDIATTDDTLSSGSLLGTRDQDVALIANAPGHYEIPALQLAWWDADAHVQRQVVLPGRSLNVLPAIAGTGAPPSAASPLPSVAVAPGAVTATNSGLRLLKTPGMLALTLWQGLSLVLALLWIVTLLAWWRSRQNGTREPVVGKPNPTPKARKMQVPSNPTAILAGLQSACRQNDPKAARQHLMDWCLMAWPKAPPRGLIGLSERLNNARFTAALQDLDRACSLNVPWQGDALAQAFITFPAVVKSTKTSEDLPDLYD
jgi:hypothetical protein